MGKGKKTAAANPSDDDALLDAAIADATAAAAKLSTPAELSTDTSGLLHSGPLPMQRRTAIQFKYTEGSSFSMANSGAMMPSPRTDCIESNAYRNMYSMPTDSWEVETCVGIAIERLLKPRWKEIRQLGRCLSIFKVHKQPRVCEFFFMPLDEVVKTYSGRFPKCVEWVHLYNPEVEIAFWAELFQPRPGGGRTSLLTDELCGGSGSRFTIIRGENAVSGFLDEDVDRLERHLMQAMTTREEAEERLAEKQAKLEKNKRKKERQKMKKAEARAAEEEADAKIKDEERQKAAAEIAAARAARLPAPMLQGVDFASMMKPKEPPHT